VWGGYWALGHFALGLKGSSHSSISKIPIGGNVVTIPLRFTLELEGLKNQGNLKGYYELKWSPPWCAMMIVSRFIISCVDSTSKR
jgi:hypothetical protein